MGEVKGYEPPPVEQLKKDSREMAEAAKNLEQTQRKIEQGNYQMENLGKAIEFAARSQRVMDVLNERKKVLSDTKNVPYEKMGDRVFQLRDLTKDFDSLAEAMNGINTIDRGIRGGNRLSREEDMLQQLVSLEKKYKIS